MATVKRRKPKWTTLRFRKGDAAHNVMAAVQKWVRINKGTAVVMGGISVMEYGPYRYGVVVNILGQKPMKALAEGKKNARTK